MENERQFLVQIENKTSKFIDILPKVDDKISFINLYLYRNSHMKYDLEENRSVLTPYYDALNVHSQVILYKFMERYPDQDTDGHRSREKTVEGKRDEQARTQKKEKERNEHQVENEIKSEKNALEREKSVVKDIRGYAAFNTRILEKLGVCTESDYNTNTDHADAMTYCTSSLGENNDVSETMIFNNTFYDVVNSKTCKSKKETRQYIEMGSYLNDAQTVEKGDSKSNDETMNKIGSLGFNIREMKKKMRSRVISRVSSPECTGTNKRSLIDNCTSAPLGYTNFEEGLIKEYILKSQNFHPRYLLQIKDKTFIFKILFDQFIIYYKTNNEYAKYLLDKMIILISEYEIGAEESNLRALSVIMKDNNELTFVLGAFMSGKEDLFNGLVMEKKYKSLFMKMKDKREAVKHSSASNTFPVVSTDLSSTVSPVNEILPLRKTQNFEILNIPATLQQTLQEVQKGVLPINSILFHLNHASTRTIKNYKQQLFSVLLNNTFHPIVLKLLIVRTCEYKTVIAHFFSFHSYGTQRVIILECLMMLVDDGWELSGEMVRAFFTTMESTTLKFNEILEERIVAFYEKMRSVRMI